VLQVVSVLAIITNCGLALIGGNLLSWVASIPFLADSFLAQLFLTVGLEVCVTLGAK
jgi:formate-dependent nitrite reductase membrane component NrfD